MVPYASKTEPVKEERSLLMPMAQVRLVRQIWEGFDLKVN